MFITIEGPDGSGKTTQIQRIAKSMKLSGYDFIATREPGGTEISDQIRAALMSLKNKSMCPETEILLFCAARAQLVNQVIRPALSEGKIILSDRYSDSTLAYQGYGHGIDLKILREILNFATGNLSPDLTFLLDIPSEKGLQRRIINHEEWNRLDDYHLDFHKRVREGYHAMAIENPHRWVVIDGDRDADMIQEEIERIIAQRIDSDKALRK